MVVTLLSSCQHPKQIFFTMKAIPLFLEKLSDKNEDEVKHFLKRKNYRFDYSLLSIDSLSHCHAYEKYNIQKVPESIFARSNTYSALQLRIYKSNGELYSALSQCDGDFNPIPNFMNEMKDHPGQTALALVCPPLLSLALLEYEGRFLHPLISSSLHLLIPSSPHHFISSSLHLLIPLPLLLLRDQNQQQEAEDEEYHQGQNAGAHRTESAF
ncbi:MAG: hypothetical protein RL106_1029 [Bacteroidota bacterium]